MNRLQKIALFAAIASAMAAPAFAQNSATVTGTTGTTKIVAPITLAQDAPLAFGTVVKPTSGNSVITVGAGVGGVASVTSGNAAVVGASGRAHYNVTGETGMGFTISTTSLTMTRISGTETLPVTLVKSAATGTIAAGVADFGVGGSFTVASDTVSGDYTGTFNVTVAYN